ncbi:hypothetical protein [Campylobacter iguaniorum]|nr:hypothetical protein [Campylobacter iguaniorum]
MPKMCKGDEIVFENPVSMTLIIVTVAILLGITGFGIFLVNKFKESK